MPSHIVVPNAATCVPVLRTRILVSAPTTGFAVLTVKWDTTAAPLEAAVKVVVVKRQALRNLFAITTESHLENKSSFDTSKQHQ